MSMLNINDILETINMVREENLDIRTITMGISLLDCISDDESHFCINIYDKITKSLIHQAILAEILKYGTNHKANTPLVCSRKIVIIQTAYILYMQKLEDIMYTSGNLHIRLLGIHHIA